MPPWYASVAMMLAAAPRLLFEEMRGAAPL